MKRYKILKLNAKRLLTYGCTAPIKQDNYSVQYKIDLDQHNIYTSLVEEMLVMENCALFDQFEILLEKEDEELEIRDWLLNELVIVDFASVYKNDDINKEIFVKAIIENGFIMKYQDQEVHMLPFDKSGNMTRKSRISFINAERIKVMNERLNIGIEFSKISVKLSKYYAYRGLYLSTAERIEDEALIITPKTLIVIDDYYYKEPYKTAVNVKSAEFDKVDKSKVIFTKTEATTEAIPVPYDGQGVICKEYAEIINTQLKNSKIHSFQIRLPFSKGMLHTVDFHKFYSEFDATYEDTEEYFITDAFGIERNVKEAKIIINKSMFKCFDWVKVACEKDQDPMEFYCNAIKKYNHALYVSGTDLPYGHSKLTHLSYQLLNTLALTEEQFNSLIDKHMSYVHNPIKYIDMCKGEVVDEDDEQEEGSKYDFPNWQRALLINPAFAKLPYVKNQLTNIQTSLMTKLLTGKLVVTGQTRYMARDIYYMLVNLIKDSELRYKLLDGKIFSYRFFLPQGKEQKLELISDRFCGFFRNPHLSRNEQGVLVPMIRNDKSGEVYLNQLNKFEEYFGHLTGIVLFGNESLEPMALGGADFDGDLTTIITDEDVVEAMKNGVYEINNEGWLAPKRKDSIPYLKIPTMKADKNTVPTLISFEQVNNTFSQKIGLISNASVAIGQYEYGTKGLLDIDLHCSDCTILTGLEIDAAKNGRHPDLSILKENKNVLKSNYLDFLKAFNRFKKKKYYHYNNLEMENDNDEYFLKLSDSDKIKYVEEKGTFINKLPIIYMKNLQPKLQVPKTPRNSYFVFDNIKVDVQTKIKAENECKEILDTYKFYSKMFSYIQSKFDDTDYDIIISSILEQQYDEKNAKEIKEKELPKIIRFLSKKITSYKAFGKIKKKVIDEEWYLLNLDEKKQFLKDNFDVELFSKIKWDILFHSYNGGYKLLWYIICDIGKGLVPKYGIIKKEFLEIMKKNKKEIPTKLYHPEWIDEWMINYIQNRDNTVQAQLYGLCLNGLKKVMDKYWGQSDVSVKINLLFKLTKQENLSAKLFWDCFEWKELEKYVNKENGDAK